MHSRIASCFRWKAISMDAASGFCAPHLFLPGGKGGLYGWEQVRRCPEVILVEGLFDYAVLWQAGFHQRHLFDGDPSQRAPVSATLRWPADCLSGSLTPTTNQSGQRRLNGCRAGSGRRE